MIADRQNPEAWSNSDGIIAALLISYHLGIGGEYALKRYVPHDIDPAWSELGRGLLRGMQHQFVSRIIGDSKPQ